MILSRLIEIYSVFFSGLSYVYLYPLLAIAFCVFAFNLLIKLFRGISHV